MHFPNMVKEKGEFYIYIGCCFDLFLGGGISMSYIQIKEMVKFDYIYFESFTINQLDLHALVRSMSNIPSEDNYTIVTNNRYIQTVLSNIGKWDRDNTLDEKAHPEMLKELLSHMNRLGDGRLQFTQRQWQQDDLMIHLLKFAKHIYHGVQMEMIDKRSTSITNKAAIGIWDDIREMAGQILWKTPLSMTQFEKKMIQSRAKKAAKVNYLTLVQEG